VLSVSTLSQDGLKALGDAVEAKFAGLLSEPPNPAVGRAISRSMLARDVADAAAALVSGSDDSRIAAILEDMTAGKLSRREGAAAALELLADLDAL